jgi:hypothetical protein
MRLPPVPKPLQALNDPWLNVINNGWSLFRLVIGLALLAYGAVSQAGILGNADVLSIVLIVVGLLVLAATLRARRKVTEVPTNVIAAEPVPSVPDQLTPELGRGEDMLFRIDRAQDDFLSQQAGNPLVQEVVDWSLALEAKLGDEVPEFAASFKRTPPVIPGNIMRSKITLNQAKIHLDARIQVLAEIIRELRNR